MSPEMCMLNTTAWSYLFDQSKRLSGTQVPFELSASEVQSWEMQLWVHFK